MLVPASSSWNSLCLGSHSHNYIVFFASTGRYDRYVSHQLIYLEKSNLQKNETLTSWYTTLWIFKPAPCTVHMSEYINSLRILSSFVWHVYGRCLLARALELVVETQIKQKWSWNVLKQISCSTPQREFRSSTMVGTAVVRLHVF